MSTLLTMIIVGQLVLSSLILIMVLSYSVSRQSPGLLSCSVTNLLLTLLLLAIWYNMSYFMAFSRGQEVSLKSAESIETVLSGLERSQIWPHMAKQSISCPSIPVSLSPKLSKGVLPSTSTMKQWV